MLTPLEYDLIRAAEEFSAEVIEASGKEFKKLMRKLVAYLAALEIVFLNVWYFGSFLAAVIVVILIFILTVAFIVWSKRP